MPVITGRLGGFMNYVKEYDRRAKSGRNLASPGKGGP